MERDFFGWAAGRLRHEVPPRPRFAPRLVRCLLRNHVNWARWRAPILGAEADPGRDLVPRPGFAVHDCEGVVVDLDERKRLVQNLGDCEVMILRNHGLLACGQTIGQAFDNIYRLERAC